MLGERRGNYTTPTGYVPLAVGTYYWTASYSGDTNNVGVTSGVQDEPVVVSPASPSDHDGCDTDGRDGGYGIPQRRGPSDRRLQRDGHDHVHAERRRVTP